MLTVTIPVHPLTRGVLLTEYGAEPITADNHDHLFDHLSGHVCRVTGRSDRLLSARLTFAVADDLAHHIQANAVAIGARLFRWHKMHLCMYAWAMGRTRGRGHVRQAIYDWLTFHGVDEDDYSLENAYKLFQRFGKKIADRNANYPGQFRTKPGANLARIKHSRAKTARPVDQLTWSLTDAQAEMVVARFFAAITLLLKPWPRRLQRQARTYIYMLVLGLSEREAAKKFGLSRSAVNRARQTILARVRANPAIAQILEESLALPHAI